MFSMVLPGPDFSIIERTWPVIAENKAYVSIGMIGALSGLLWVQKSDYLSKIASFLKMLLTRSVERGIDDRLGLYLLLSWVFPVLVLLFLPSQSLIDVLSGSLSPLLISLFYVIPSAGLLLFGRWFKEKKHLPAWSWAEALGLGLVSSFCLVYEYPFWILASLFIGFRSFYPDGGYRFVLYHWTLLMLLKWFLTHQDHFSTAIEQNLMISLVCFVAAFAWVLYLFRSNSERIPSIRLQWFGVPLVFFYITAFYLQYKAGL